MIAAVRMVFGFDGLLVCGGDPVQDVDGRDGWHRDGALSFAGARASCVAGTAECEGAVAHGCGHGAAWPLMWSAA